MMKICYKCRKEEEMEENQFLCEVCSEKHKLEVYQTEASPILLKHYYDKDKENAEKIKETIEGDSYFYLTDRVLQYVGEKGIYTSAIDILKYLKETKSKYEKEKNRRRKLIY